MTPEPSQSKRATPAGSAVRAAGLLMIVVLASWAAHLLKDALDLTMMPNNEKQVHRLLMIGAVAYIG
ncbi:MAG: hypothetical protein NWQ37_16990, partial [Marivita lacus]|nr:hypothetical protein [Marivita lacus]